MVNCRDAMTDHRVNAGAREHMKLRSILAVPVLQHGNVVGAIEVLCSRPDAFSERDVAKLEQLAEITSKLDFD
jgi:GAF domain-containing protein